MGEGSAALQGWLAGAVRGRRGAIAAGTVTAGDVASVVIDADPDSDFEIGSISKAVTGLLYADAVAAGIVEPSTRLGGLLGLGDGPVAGSRCPKAGHKDIFDWPEEDIAALIDKRHSLIRRGEALAGRSAEGLGAIME